MSRFDLRELARHGAEHRIRQIREEIAEILRQFPDLDAPRRERRSAYPPNELAALAGRQSATEDAQRKGRRSMSAAQRRAVSERMRKYWARRNAGAKKQKSG